MPNPVQYQGTFEQHPVPQQISSYQFRLVGDMTIKQFFQLAGGAVVALLFYSSPLPAILRWPLIIASALSGAAFAFLPVQERPLEEWVVSFFRSVYSPTIFKWRKAKEKTQFFQAEAVKPIAQAVATPIPTPQVKSVQVAEEVKTSSEVNLEVEEKAYLTKIDKMLTTAIPKTPQVQVPKSSPQQLQPRPAQAPMGPLQTTKVGQILTPSDITARVNQAQFSPNAAPPNPPTQPNIVVGQVMDSDGKIAETAILDIKDSQGRPVRALRTNKVGHFFTVTPLSNGTYKIEVEKEGLEFEPVSFNASGAIILPIAIKARRKRAQSGGQAKSP